MRYLSVFVQTAGERSGLKSGERYVLYVRRIRKRKPVPGVFHEVFSPFTLRFYRIPEDIFRDMRPHAVLHYTNPEAIAGMIIKKLNTPFFKTTKKIVVMVDDLMSMTDWDDWDVGEWVGE